MVSVEQLLRTALVNDATVAGFFGGNPANARIYETQAPQNPTYPFATYQRISTVPLYVHSSLGSSSNQASVGRVRMQITVWCQGASSASQRDTITRAILAVLNGFNAFELPQSVPVLRQAPTRLLNRFSSIEPQTQPPVFKAVLDIELYYQDQ